MTDNSLLFKDLPTSFSLVFVLFGGTTHSLEYDDRIIDRFLFLWNPAGKGRLAEKGGGGGERGLPPPSNSTTGIIKTGLFKSRAPHSTKRVQ